MTTQEREPIPGSVIEALLEVRESGEVNMMNRPGVARIAGVIGHYEAADWLGDNRNRERYMEALIAMGEARKAGQ